MSYFREVNVGGTFPQLGTFQAFFGFVPNVFWAQTLLPRVIEAEAGIARAVLLEDRGLSRIQKGSISLTASVAYGSEYWVAGYYQMLRSQGVPDSTLNEIVINHHRADLPISDKALLDFTRKLATRAPGSPGEISLNSDATRSTTNPSWKP